MQQAQTPRSSRVLDLTYSGWSEYDVKEKAWEVLLFTGDKYIKRDFRGNFINIGNGKVKTLGEIFPDIRNCVDSQGFLIAKRKTYRQPLRPFTKRRARVPRS